MSARHPHHIYVKSLVAAMTRKEGTRPIVQSFHAHSSCRVDLGMRCCPTSRPFCCLQVVFGVSRCLLRCRVNAGMRRCEARSHALQDMPFAHFVWCVGVSWYGCLVMLSTVREQSPHACCFWFFASILLAVCWGRLLNVGEPRCPRSHFVQGWP